MAPKPPLDVKIEVILDDKNKKYYPGDQVEGKIFVTSNQTYQMSNLRLAWTGRIRVQPIQTNKDFRIYFDECWKLGPKIMKSKTKTQKDNSQVPYFITQLVLVADNQSIEPKVELSKNKTVGFTFKVNVPNDRPLPSSTVGSTLNKIIYLLEAFIDGKTEEKPVFFGQRVVPVLEAIYTRTEELMKPQRAEQVFMVSLLNQPNTEFTCAMRITLPCRGCQPGVAIPVSITIWNNIEFSRKQGISISLFRVNQVLANGRAYTSPGEKVHRVIADLNILADENDTKVQTVRVGLPIPKGTMPTITLEKSELLSIAYYIRVQVFAQEGIYTSTTDNTKSQFMVVDIPFIVGTLGSPLSDSTTTTPISSPTSAHESIKSGSGIKSPFTSPRLFETPLANFNNSNLTTPIASPELLNNSNDSALKSNATLNNETDSVITVESNSSSTTTSGNNNRNSTVISHTSQSNSNNNNNNNTSSSRLIGGMFRKSSSGSNISRLSTDENEKKKKRNVFSRLYGRTKTPPATTVVVTTEENITAVEADKTTTEDRQEDQATLAVSNQGGGVFNLFPDDDDDEEEIPIEEKPLEETEEMLKTKQVFNMFPDSDDEEEEEVVVAVVPPPQPQSSTPPTPQTSNNGVFNMFPDSDEEEEEEKNRSGNGIPAAPAAENSMTETKKEDPSRKIIENSMTNQRLTTSHVFNMFNDDSSDEEPVVVKPNEHEYSKPHQIEQEEEEQEVHFNKPNTPINDSSDDEEDDLLTVLAKREKLYSSFR